MAIDPSIAMGYRGLGELPNPMNQLAQVSQIQSSQRQGEMAQMQIQQMRRDETALTQFYADVAKNGGPTNPVEIEDAMIKSGVRDIVNSGLTARMTRSKLENQQKQFAGIMGARMPTGAPMAAPAAAPMAAPEPGSFGADVAARTAAIPAFARGGNALIPEQAPRVNALGGGGANNAAEIAFKQQQRDALIGMGTTQSIAAAKAIDADIALLAKEPVYHTVTGVGLVNPRDKSVVVPSVETAPNSIRELEAFMKMTPQQQDTFMKMKRASASNTVTNVNAFAPASEEAQKDFMKSTRATYDTLKQAPATLKNIEEAKKLVPAAAAFMGTGGEGLKEAASFLNNRLGMNIDTKGVVAASELQSRLFQGILDNLKKLDAQPSQSQQAALQTALGSLNTDPNALPRVLDSFADTIRAKVDLHNTEVTGAESKGVKFPYSPIINLPAKTSGGGNETWVRDAKGTLVRKQ